MLLLLCVGLGVGGSVLGSGIGAGVFIAFVPRPAALFNTALPRSAIVPADHHLLRRPSSSVTH